MRTLIEYDPLLAFVAGLIVLALVSGRLLGVQVSWLRRLLAAMIGLIAGTVAYYVASRQLISAIDPRLGFGLTALLVTMSLLVLLELLSRPGPRRAGGRGLRLPQPVGAVRRRAGNARRYLQVAWICARNGVGPELRAGSRPRGLGRRLRLTLERSGGGFVKVGQMLSTRGDLLPPELLSELTRLQDDVAPARPEAVAALLTEELGAPPDEVFAEFAVHPIAAGSIAQVHLARLRSGELAAVKVQRPGVRCLIERDLEIGLRMADRLERQTAWASHIRLRELAREFAAALREELDFQIERGNLEAIEAGGTVRVPKVYRELSTGRVLTMEWLDGVCLREAAPRLDQLGIDRAAFARGLLRSLLRQILVGGVFHADPHPGNVWVLRDGTPALIDLGSVGRLNVLEQSSLKRILVAFNERDPGHLRDALIDLAPVYDLLLEERLERALGQFIARRLAPGMMPGAAMFGDLFRLLSEFDLALPPQVAAVFRAVITLDGTLRSLVPEFELIQEARPFATEAVHETLQGSALEGELVAQLPLLRRLPRRVDQLAGIAAGRGLAIRVSLFEGEHDRTLVTRLVDRGLLAFVGAVLGGLAVALLASPDSPMVAPGVTLLQMVGYSTLLASAILLLRVLLAVARDRLA